MTKPLYQWVIDRLAEQRQSLIHFFDREALRIYMKAKRGVQEEMRFEGYNPSYKVLGHNLANSEEQSSPPFILLPYPKTAVESLRTAQPNIRIDNRSQNTGATAWINVPLNGDVAANTVLDLIDEAYAYVVTQLKDEERALLDLIDGRRIDEAKIRALADIYSLEERTDEILRLLQPCVGIQSTGKTLDYGIDKQASKLGGSPYLPEGIDWPAFNGIPLGFLAQINLAEIPPYAAKKALPSSGILYFFSAYGWGEHFPWDEVGNPEASKVIYFNGDLGTLKYMPVPDGMPVGGIYDVCKVRFLDEWSLPRSEEDARDPVLISLDWSEDEYEQFDDMVFGLNDLYTALGTGDHQLLGYCQTIQNTITESGERLLIEIGCDYMGTGFAWGDGGNLFFIIPENDLKACRFERVRVELQSG